MTEIIGVRFKNGGKEYYFNPNGMKFNPGDHVIIETARGVEFGECTQSNTMVDEMTLFSPLRPVLRAATADDVRTVELNKKKEARAFEICERKIADHNLDMKLVNVEYNFEGSKILFFFTSDGRVDFRELVKDLAAVFHTRIELRQIGVRDEAKMLGGLGICGRPFCCHQFLEDFQPVSIKMAKTQNLSLNPTKISGTCGRLMCCLKYEQDAYEDALKRCPKNDSLVETSAGVGVVCQVNLLRETVKVRLDNAPESPQVFPCEEIRVIRSGKGKRPEGYELPDPAERPTGLKKTAPPTPKVAQPERKPTQPERKPVQSERKAAFHESAASAALAEEKDAAGKEKASRRSRRSRSGRGRGEGTAAPTPDKKETLQKESKREGQSRLKPQKKDRSTQTSRRSGDEKGQESAAPSEKKQGNPRRNNPHRPRRRNTPKPQSGGEG